MRERRSIWGGLSSVFDLWHAPMPATSDFDREMASLLQDRLPDFAMVLSDLRRTMIHEARTMPRNERERIESELRADFAFPFERRLGLDEPSPGDSADGEQLYLPFARPASRQ